MIYFSLKAVIKLATRYKTPGSEDYLERLMKALFNVIYFFGKKGQDLKKNLFF